jgi:hypothetical protein
MTKQTSEVTDLIGKLRDGTLTLEDLARRFRARSWPPTKPPPPDSYVEMARRASEDPRPDVPNSFDEVVAAYGRGELTDEEFDVLSEAVAESIRSEHSSG